MARKQSGSKKEANNKQKKSKAETNVNENENENVNENVNENDYMSDSCVDGSSEIAIDSCVDGLQEVVDFYENNIGIIAPYGLEVMQDYLQEMPKELLVFAMKKAVEADKMTIQYIKGILNNWSKKGIKTLLQAQQEDELFKKQKDKSKPEKKDYQRDYSNADLSFLYANNEGRWYMWIKVV